MPAKKIIIIFIVVILAFGAGIYFSAQGGPASGWKDNLITYFDGLNKGVQDFQKTDIGQTLAQVEKQIFAPSPLNIGGLEKPVVLLQSKIILETNLQRQQNGNLGSQPLIALDLGERLQNALSLGALRAFE